MPEWPDWSGETVVIVASGPSASGVDLGKGRGRAKYLAVKDGWRLCPWADALYACDHHWWAHYHGIPEFKGVRLAYDKLTIDKWGGLKVTIARVVPHLLFKKIGHVGWGGHSGFHALNLAMQFGAKRIILVGFDLRTDKGKHFFGEHPYDKTRPIAANVDKWRKILDDQAPVIRERGVEVFNCSPVSKLTAFPKMTFEEALDACCEVYV